MFEPGSHLHHAYMDEPPGSSMNAVDLADYYPPSGIASQSRNGAGLPANPGASGNARSLSGSASASVQLGGSPAIAMIAIVALSLFLLHLE